MAQQRVKWRVQRAESRGLCLRYSTAECDGTSGWKTRTWLRLKTEYKVITRKLPQSRGKWRKTCNQLKVVKLSGEIRLYSDVIMSQSGAYRLRGHGRSDAAPACSEVVHSESTFGETQPDVMMRWPIAAHYQTEMSCKTLPWGSTKTLLGGQENVSLSLVTLKVKFGFTVIF